MVVAGAGLVDATGFLSFGRLFLASPDANAIVAAVASSDNDRLALHAGGAILAFLAGVVLTGLATHRLARYRRSVILLATWALLGLAFLIVQTGADYLAALMSAMAMGAVHCVFERDDARFKDALWPSVQLARFGEALAEGRIGGTRFAALLWLMFLGGGALGAVLSLLAPDGTLALAAGLILLLTSSAWLVERRLRSENPSKPDGA